MDPLALDRPALLTAWEAHAATLPAPVRGTPGFIADEIASMRRPHFQQVGRAARVHIDPAGDNTRSKIAVAAVGVLRAHARGDRVAANIYYAIPITPAALIAALLVMSDPDMQPHVWAPLAWQMTPTMLGAALNRLGMVPAELEAA